ncbi:DUF2971 domain-containing protein [uncultured Stenotrophomonas sp.]|uniref:DUF2971 domain-containing protein n=1 Tax=uncultured Stenotrophomonas sp. TaxID=165438 RepID=UPI0025E989E0|nr:DUF2971 domain-containing protein [uncultured Stenotrophomonas sp.]
MPPSMPQLRYSPQSNDELLYHYCSAETLLAVLSHGTLRLCDLATMNDSMELSWGAKLLGEILARDEILRLVRTEGTIDEFLASAGSKFKVLASCFSMRKDQLSQWRAYANNGAGFCIGFSAASIRALRGTMMRVCYDVEAQRKMLESAFEQSLVSSAKPDGLDANSVRWAIMDLLLDVAGMKNPAFSEESEVRLCNPIMVDDAAPMPKLSYPSQLLEPPDLKFLMRGTNPTPYSDLKLPDKLEAIREVWIGPRAEASEMQMKVMLGTMGYTKTQVIKSAASYR